MYTILEQDRHGILKVVDPKGNELLVCSKCFSLERGGGIVGPEGYCYGCGWRFVDNWEESKFSEALNLPETEVIKTEKKPRKTRINNKDKETYKVAPRQRKGKRI